MDYLEFKMALRAIGEAEKAGEYWQLLESTISNIDENEFKNNMFAVVGKNYPGNIHYFPALDMILQQIISIPYEPKKLILKILVNDGEKKYWGTRPAMKFIKCELAEVENQANQEPATPPPATEPEPPKAKPQKPIPDLSEIFKSKDYFDMVIKHLENDEFIKPDRITGRFKWLKSKAFLAGLAFVLEKNNRLQNLEKYPNFKINTDKKQDLGRVFCNYFENVTFNEIQERAFQNSSITGTHRKNYFWIKEV